MAMAVAKQLLASPFYLKLRTRTPRCSPPPSLLQSVGFHLRTSHSRILSVHTRRLRTAKRDTSGAFLSRTSYSTAGPVDGRGGNNNGKKMCVIYSNGCSSEEAKTRFSRSLSRVKKRTRSPLEFDRSQWEDHHTDSVGIEGKLGKKEKRGVSNGGHIPVMLGEVLEVFRRCQLHSFVDCTLGAAGHSTSLIKGHPEMTAFIGMDIDSTALVLAQSRINGLLQDGSFPSLRTYTHLTSFKHVRSVVSGVTDAMGGTPLSTNGVDGILMDLGMSSMQVDNSDRGFSILAHGPLDMRMNPQTSLKAADILNSWPEAEVGRILREYGEENNWRLLLRKIMSARTNGGLHSTTDLVDLIKRSSPKSGGRHGWIKTATRVFQALRIAVNDELKTLEDALYACFNCLSPGGRLAVISFHSLEDRIVKYAFLSMICKEDENGQDYCMKQTDDSYCTEETWRNGRIAGKNGCVLTKRPITPTEDEENMNPRSRSAKLRVIQKF